MRRGIAAVGQVSAPAGQTQTRGCGQQCCHHCPVLLHHRVDRLRRLPLSSLHHSFSYGGLWRTRVLDVTVTGRPKAFSSDDSVGGLLGGSMMRLARVLVGDPGGAQTELVLPYDAR